MSIQYTNIPNESSNSASVLDHYAKNAAALVKVHIGAKKPVGDEWQNRSSTDPAEWAKWKTLSFNLGVHAGKSRLITIDLDTTKEGGREGVWKRYCEWCLANGLPVYAPHVSTARQGMHIYFQVPEDVDAMALKASAKKLGAGIDVLAGNKQSIAAGSYYDGTADGKDSGWYTLISDAPPHPAPQVLIEHCTPKRTEAASAPVAPALDGYHVEEVIWWVDQKLKGDWKDDPDSPWNEQGEWIFFGKALKLHFPNADGFELWMRATHGGHDVAEDRWNNEHDFKTEWFDGARTLKSYLANGDITWMFRGMLGCPMAPTGPLAPGTPPPSQREEEDDDAPLLLSDFLAYLPMNTFIYVPTRAHWPAATINSALPRVEIGKEPDKSGVLQPVTIAVSMWLARNQAVRCLTWAPGHPLVIRDKTINGDSGWVHTPGAKTFNEYRAPTIEHKAGDASPWLSHVHRVFGDSDAKHIIQWCAHRVQYPADKINHALVLGGGSGVGKDTLIEPLKAAVGSWNFKETSPVTMMGQFDPSKKGVVLRVNEARDLGDMTRNEFYDRMKNLTAAPPDVLPVNEKYLKEHYIPNVCGVIVTTNYEDAIALPPDDRRFFVAWTDCKQEDFSKEYFDGLYAWFRNGGNEIVAHYLATLDISDFNAKAPPPRTEAWHKMVGSSAAPEDAELHDAIDKLGNPDAVTVAAILRKAEPALMDYLRDRRNSRSIPRRFKGCGYVAVRNEDATDGLWRVGGKRQAIYAKVALNERDRILAARRLAVPPLPY